MARKATSKKKPVKKAVGLPWRKRVRRWVLRAVAIVFLVTVALVLLGALINPPTTAYMFTEGRRLGGVKQTWVSIDKVAPVMARAAVAAEDANFCQHWGFDLPAIKMAIEQGSARGASTISQQTVKNVYLWHGRLWARKAAEALITPLVEAIWSKRRIIEVYLNVAEFDEGVFGVEAAARHYFGVSAADLSATQAAQLAAILPSPKTRSASRPSGFVLKRARQVRDGAATIGKDGRAACFES
ncbi:monofunctional biosynthetic peptidoglycan transglycosylase [Sulfitobacter sp. M57]|uniref:monofunctional biosynthetic peptidoglycan transglycosylase n=1 Tax=unclassified Sulfitobacter TaxID=196795 RepID=UPI0023E17530|nr:MULTISPECIES: monofunctional biosynthetic peptidoglycan transglycosylase [unclassified Sulfitobacter]MDF3414897.1 monofunctional biosynthetic peptidoglycan transglycosylase [Sulfitobacter sp. KE5]MDF3422378.1 monofunctional biosynthetic peptidoglycan transglycosylase [Sulfitobacter sp. KE43]MDF3433443.1 monofunctional biosynthetic peptidoglycan transglycosylase [Sulfitobacter sp. KE42]MDF3459083.1 monofunctional biosynthetic peptidoglycan transglycosylase [Sulfitobacter sp. S74]MDF3462982.1